MTAVAFYHLTRSSAVEALPLLLAKTLDAGKTALVCCDDARFNQFSTAIWSHQPNSWLPHGIAGRDDDDAGICPIWITNTPDQNSNDGRFIFYLDGLEVDIPQTAERVFVLFDGRDDAAVGHARQQWKGLRDHGHDLTYWQQNDRGGWQQSA
ncbi:MAG: DNA polymerase III subunit chi [SAR116 cluster bacterium MED-G04]|jgi:DNA polymerase-3 subunit chi|nr:MAG: DNA polymerase III subunit chi [SAR116 cluster bacterium MED-G04]HCD50287.1 DNA polymerase III subunit chi [Alphaproteobacteria bacterium]HCV63167.1 DNA polymerase III subunit chi [Alphaproteobacteria bacterium]|tara:strand:- start:1903 stop:2358 length:456 start_codon:yes stop_codon:yes gene_type:complete